MKKDYLLKIFEELPFPCFVLKAEAAHFEILLANQEILKLFNKSSSEVLGKSVSEVYNTEFYEKILKDSLIKSRRFQKKDIVDPVPYNFDGKHGGFWEIENLPVEDKGSIYVLQILKKSVTENGLVKEDDQQYEHFIANNPDGLYSLDASGVFTTANEGIAKIAEVPIKDLLGMDFFPFADTRDKDKILDHFQKALKGEPNTFEALFKTAKGKDKILLISLMPINVNNKIVGTYGRAKDITNLRNSEKIIIEKSHFLEVNSLFLSLLNENELNVETLEKAFAIVGQTIKTDRMYYFEAYQKKDTGETLLSMKAEWTSEIATAEIHNPDMQELSAAKLQEIMGPLTNNLPFTANYSQLQESELKEIFKDQQIKSMLLLPIFIQNDLYGFIGFDDCTDERIWSNEEIQFLKGLAKNFTNALEKRRAETALKQKEEDLKQSEEKFKALVQEGSDLIGILDIEGNYLFVSDTTNSLLGIEPAQLLGRNAFEFIHPDDLTEVQEKFSELENVKRIKAQFRFKDNDGKWRWLETTATNLLSDPAINGIVVNSKDVTTIIEQEKEIEQINERYRLAAKATQDIIYDWNLETDDVIRYYRSVEDLFGYTPEEVEDRHFWRNHIHPQDVPELRNKLDSVLPDKEEHFISTEYRLRRNDGSYARIRDRGFILRNEKGKAIRLIGASSDISEITAKEEALKIANQRFHLAMKATNEMIWDWDMETDRIVRNQAFTDIYGYSLDENYDTEFWLSKIHYEDQLRVKNSFKTALAQSNLLKWKEEYRVYKENGEIAHVVDRASMIRDVFGNVIRVVGAVLDVTESKRLLQEVRNQNQTFKEIAWEQSHVVRAPLARLQGLLHLVELKDYSIMTEEELLINIKNAADEIDGIIKGIVSRIEKIETEDENEE